MMSYKRALTYRLANKEFSNFENVSLMTLHRVRVFLDLIHLLNNKYKNKS